MPTGTGTTANPDIPYVWLLVCTNQPPDAQVQDPPEQHLEDVRYVDLQPGSNSLGHCPEPGYTLRFMKSYALVNESGDELYLGHVMEGFGGGFVTVISFFVLGIIGAFVLRALRPMD